MVATVIAVPCPRSAQYRARTQLNDEIIAPRTARGVSNGSARCRSVDHAPSSDCSRKDAREFSRACRLAHPRCDYYAIRPITLSAMRRTMDRPQSILAAKRPDAFDFEPGSGSGAHGAPGGVAVDERAMSGRRVRRMYPRGEWLHTDRGLELRFALGGVR